MANFFKFLMLPAILATAHDTAHHSFESSQMQMAPPPPLPNFLQPPLLPYKGYGGFGGYGGPFYPRTEHYETSVGGHIIRVEHVDLFPHSAMQHNAGMGNKINGENLGVKPLLSNQNPFIGNGRGLPPLPLCIDLYPMCPLLATYCNYAQVSDICQKTCICGWLGFNGAAANGGGNDPFLSNRYTGRRKK